MGARKPRQNDKGLKVAREILERVIAEEEEMAADNKWISLKERLPEINQSVLVWDGKNIRLLHHMRNHKKESVWWDDEGWATTEHWGITHWMPLPEPPAESEDSQ